MCSPWMRDPRFAFTHVRSPQEQPKRALLSPSGAGDVMCTTRHALCCRMRPRTGHMGAWLLGAGVVHGVPTLDEHKRNRAVEWLGWTFLSILRVPWPGWDTRVPWWGLRRPEQHRSCGFGHRFPVPGASALQRMGQKSGAGNGFFLYCLFFDLILIVGFQRGLFRVRRCAWSRQRG